MHASRWLAIALASTSLISLGACSGGSDAPAVDSSSSGGSGSGELPGSSSGEAPSSSSGDVPTSSSSSGTVVPDGGTGSSGEPPIPYSPTNQIKDGDETDVDCGGGVAPACQNFQACLVGADCTNLSCQDDVCAEPTHADQVTNGDETDVDCGGPTAAPCGEALDCITGSDCIQKVCKVGACAAPTTDDRVTNGNETGIDCGHQTPFLCRAGYSCLENVDCTSEVCTENRCLSSNSHDGAKNGDETDVDCGGLTAARCAVGLVCLGGTDCKEGVCENGTCSAPTHGDGVSNGDETGIDCGGPTAATCAVGQVCAAGSDCVEGVCANTKCQAPLHNDEVKNGDETDVDCGGPTAPVKCSTNQACAAGTDCADKLCGGNKCTAPSFTDGVQNGKEIATDCGGADATTTAQRCKSGTPNCAADNDCRSLGCNTAGVCAVHRSCKAEMGGRTCGTGGAGGVGAANWEDCCATAEVTVPQEGGAKIQLGKYSVTGGRMRQFLTSINYDVRTFVRQARAAGQIPKIPASSNRSNSSTYSVLEPAWDMYLPRGFLPLDVNTVDAATGQTELTGTSQSNESIPGAYAGIFYHLGGFIYSGNSQGQTGCYPNNPGTHIFRFSDDMYPEGATKEPAPVQSQDVYDTKAMNCATYLVAQAFCVWDGGRLQTTSEWFNAWGPSTYPWSATQGNKTAHAVGSAKSTLCRFPTATDDNQGAQNGCSTWNVASESNGLAVFNYSYEYPALSGNDFSVFISAPGRTTGRGPYGHADLLGEVFEVTSDVVYNANPKSATHSWTNPGSWEGHGWGKNVNGWGTTMLVNKYGKTGLRCAYPTNLDQ